MSEKIPIQSVTSSTLPAATMAALPPVPVCQNDHYVVQAAQVVRESERGLLVRARLPDQCERCTGRGGCTLGLFGRWALRRPQTIVIPTKQMFAAGSWIWIGLPKLIFLRSLLFLYLLPIICVLFGGGFGGWFLPLPWPPDLRSALGMLVGGIVGALWARWCISRTVGASPAQSVRVMWPEQEPASNKLQ